MTRHLFIICFILFAQEVRSQREAYVWYFGIRTGGVEFSPSSRFLYLTDYGRYIYQVDLSSLNVAQTIVKIDNENHKYQDQAQLQLAPDGKIYVSSYGRSYLGTIDHPDSLAQKCGYRSNAIHIPENGINFSQQSLPNFVSSFLHKPELYPPSPFFEMPNVITPNADGYNDEFLPIKKFNVKELHVTILNRWGEVIYNSVGLLRGWDGGGHPTGVYYWKADYTGLNGRTYTQKGHVELKR